MAVAAFLFLCCLDSVGVAIRNMPSEEKMLPDNEQPERDPQTWGERPVLPSWQTWGERPVLPKPPEYYKFVELRPGMAEFRGAVLYAKWHCWRFASAQVIGVTRTMLDLVLKALPRNPDSEKLIPPILLVMQEHSANNAGIPVEWRGMKVRNMYEDGKGLIQALQNVFQNDKITLTFQPEELPNVQSVESMKRMIDLFIHAIYNVDVGDVMALNNTLTYSLVIASEKLLAPQEQENLREKQWLRITAYGHAFVIFRRKSDGKLMYVDSNGIGKGKHGDDREAVPLEKRPNTSRDGQAGVMQLFEWKGDETSPATSPKGWAHASCTERIRCNFKLDSDDLQQPYWTLHH